MRDRHYFLRDLYVFENKLTGMIKIGRSIDTQKRLVGVAAQGGNALTLIRVIPLSGDLEKQVHARLAPYRRKPGEWFVNQGDVREFYERVSSRPELERWIADRVLPDRKPRSGQWTYGVRGWSRSFGERGLRVHVFQKGHGQVFYRTLWLDGRRINRKSLATRDRKTATQIAENLVWLLTESRRLDMSVDEVIRRPLNSMELEVLPPAGRRMRGTRYVEAERRPSG